MKQISEVIQTFPEEGLTVNLEKWNFGKGDVKSLDRLVVSGTHFPDPEKLEAMKKWAVSANQKELRIVLRISSYYIEYITIFAIIVLPLTSLKKKQISWRKPEEEAFQSLKNHLVKMPSLCTP